MNHPNDTQVMSVAYFKIDRDGQWYHDGAPIDRKALAKLFSDRALKRDEGGEYWLQTPFEKYPVEVADVPYVIVDFEEVNAGIDFITNMEERVPLGPEHPLELREFDGVMLPYIEIRDGLYARLGRNVYHELAQRFGVNIKSRGGQYPLGKLKGE